VLLNPEQIASYDSFFTRRLLDWCSKSTKTLPPVGKIFTVIKFKMAIGHHGLITCKIRAAARLWTAVLFLCFSYGAMVWVYLGNWWLTSVYFIGRPYAIAWLRSRCIHCVYIWGATGLHDCVLYPPTRFLHRRPGKSLIEWNVLPRIQISRSIGLYKQRLCVCWRVTVTCLACLATECLLNFTIGDSL